MYTISILVSLKIVKMKKDEHINLLNKFLDGESSIAEKKLLNSMLDNPNQFDDLMSEHWDSASNEVDSRIEKKIFEVISNERRIKKNILFSHFWKVASVILFISTLGLSFFVYDSITNKRSEDQQWMVSVEKGQKANMTLPDGTQVWLNSDSKITYKSNFNLANRDVSLEGEAFFEVAKNEKNPFVVHTKQMSIKAIGTAFNVKAYNDDPDIITTLVSGKVRVNTPAKSQLLEPNQRLVYERNEKRTIISNEQDIESFSAWRENELVFNHQNFKSIAKVLERHYNIRFVFDDSRLEGYCFSGTIPNTGLESLLEIFTLTSPMSYQIKDSVIYLGINKKVNRHFDQILKINK